MRVFLCAFVIHQAFFTHGVIRTGSFMNRLIKVEHVQHDNVRKYEGPKPRWHQTDLHWRDPLCDGIITTETPFTMPDHIDDKQYEVTTAIPYLTLGPIPGIDYHPPLLNISSCERIYIDKFETSDENYDYTAESLEMIQIPESEVFNNTAVFMNSMELGAMPMYPMLNPPLY